MAIVHREVTRAFVDRFDLLGPRRVERRTLFVGAMQQHRDRRARGRDRAFASGVFAIIEHGAERQLHHPVEAVDGEERERTVADVVRDGLAFRSLHSHDPFHVDGPSCAEALGLQHLDRRALPLGLFAAQQRLDRSYVTGDGRPGERSLAEAVPAREAGADTDHRPGRERGPRARRSRRRWSSGGAGWG